jgi:tetratricopeptide (TPR) repeat protein
VVSQPYQTARLADLERSDGWAPIRVALDVEAFGINAWTAHAAGDTIIPEHDEAPSRHEELFLVTAGHATFMVAGDELDAPAGAIVFVRDPSVSRGAVARDPETTVLSVGAAAGEAFRPRSWETNRDVIALLDAGRYTEAKQLLLDALGRYDDRDTMLYNLACAEARLGEHDDAIGHLREAIGVRPSLAEHMADDHDLAPLRDDPRFGEITGGG